MSDLTFFKRLTFAFQVVTTLSGFAVIVWFGWKAWLLASLYAFSVAMGVWCKNEREAEEKKVRR